jgi:hypothetical protein
MSSNRKDELYLALKGARERLCTIEVLAGPEGSSTRRHVQAAIDAIDCAAWCSGVGIDHPATFPERWPVELSVDPPGVLVQHPGALEATRLMRPDEREGWWLMLANAVGTGLSPVAVNRLVMEDADVLAAERIGRRTAAARITYEAGKQSAVRDLRNRGWRPPSRLSHARAQVRRWWRS